MNRHINYFRPGQVSDCHNSRETTLQDTWHTRRCYYYNSGSWDRCSKSKPDDKISAQKRRRPLPQIFSLPLILLLLLPITAAFLQRTQELRPLRGLTLASSSYRHPFDDQPFFANLPPKRNNSTAELPPEVRDWTTLMANSNGRQQGVWTSGGPATKSNFNSTYEYIPSMPESISHANKSILTEDDELAIQKFWSELQPTLSYLPKRRHADVYRALRVAYECHHGQMRKSGDPFVIHPVQVALLLTGLKMDTETIMAGLLHDTVEDTDMTFDQLEQLFGPVVKSIVEGETKVSKLPKLAFSPDEQENISTIANGSPKGGATSAAGKANSYDEQAENLRQMFVAMTEDYRIIIVKLADRLHNMRTLQHMKPAKQIKISRETLDIFAPLAHRMGIWQFKSELEDISFQYLYPQEYKRLNRKLRTHQRHLSQVLEQSQLLLKQQLQEDPTLKEQAANVEVVGRTKEIYSLWHKMETKGQRNLDQIGDVVALRVIITPKTQQEEEFDEGESNSEDEITKDDDHDFKSEKSLSRADAPARSATSNGNNPDRGVWLCYHVLGLVQHLPGFQPVPTRVKDYISFPKPNGYQSLHTAVMLQGQTIEVQIRTSTMHQVAEFGMASHWAYTDSKRMPHSDVYNTPWLSSIKEWQKDRISSRDFVESVRRELLGKRVFVFLRNGKILNLARGATAIDAAFQIHTEIGLEMHGVEINGKPVPFSYELRNGDVVSILTGKGKPSLDWMRYAKSRSTRSKLRAYFRLKQKESLREAGKILLMDYLWMHGPTIEQHRPFVKVPSTVDDIAEVLHERQKEQVEAETILKQYEDIDDLLIDLGRQHDRSMLHNVVARLFEVPSKALVEAEHNKNRKLLVPGSVVDAVKQSRRNAKYAAKAVQHNGEQNLGGTPGMKNMPSWPHLQESRAPTMLDKLFDNLNSSMEYADPEHLCRHCLPVYGDTIVGTRPAPIQDASGSFTRGGSMDAITMVHRIGCPVAQRAINLASASIALSKEHRVDSVSLRRMASRRSSQASTSALLQDDVPVKLEWSDYDNDAESMVFITEVVIVAEDRKLLLADCSEIVSEMSEIVKTGSASSEEHATLVFLVQIDGLHQLQRLMDRLQQIRSVMSVERRFGSELLSSTR